MKKILTLLILITSSLAMANAQVGSKSALIHMGYQSHYERFGFGVEGRYEFIENFRIAPEVAFFIPNKHTTGLDVNLNLQYTLKNVLDGLTIYPLAGLNMNNNRFSYHGFTNRFTEFGFNLGAGAEYDLDMGFLSFDMKATFANKTYGQFMLGYGLRF